MQRVTVSIYPCVVHSHQRRALAIAVQRGHHPLGICFASYRIPCTKGCPHFQTPRSHWHHGQEAAVRCRASHSGMQCVTVSIYPCVVRSHRRCALAIIVQHGHHLGVCLASCRILCAKGSLHFQTPRLHWHHDREVAVRCRASHCGMRCVMVSIYPCVVRSHQCRAPAVAVQHGYHVLGFRICLVTLCARGFLHCRSPRLLLHHGREGAVRCRASNGRTQSVMVSIYA